MNDRGLTIAAWLVLVALFALLEIGAWSTRHRFPGIGDAVTWIVGFPAGRLAFAVGWMWLGWHVFAR